MTSISIRWPQCEVGPCVEGPEPRSQTCSVTFSFSTGKMRSPWPIRIGVVGHAEGAKEEALSGPGYDGGDVLEGLSGRVEAVPSLAAS